MTIRSEVSVPATVPAAHAVLFPQATPPIHASSEVYRDALVDYVSRRDPGAITRALDEIADELSAEERAFTTAAARRTLAQSKW